MAHPIVGDDELGASPLLLCSLWLTVNSRNSEARHLSRSAASVSPGLWRNVEARHVTLDDVFIAQFGSASSTRRVIEFAVNGILGHWVGDHLPYDGRGPASADICLTIVMRSYEPVTCRMVELGHGPSTRHREWSEGI